MVDDPSSNGEVMQCPHCRAENPAGTEVCVGCGQSIADEEWMSGTLLDSETIDAPPTDSEQATSLTIDEAPAESQQVTSKTIDSQVVPAEGVAVPTPVGTAAPGAHEPGSVLGDRYRIDEFLGFGGMGSVYKAFDLELEREVALKVIRPHMADDPNVLARFKQEIILSREVTHRNVVRIFDLGQADDTRFISMEFIEGTTLHGLLKERGPLPAEEAIEIVEQVCLALDAAHQQGVVHRDLKPANIMIEPGGRVVVMDFGIARSLESSGMTQTGALLGTPDYMSPEQVKGESVDARSDLFALGIIFYQLLTGELPYKGNTPMAAMYTRTQKRAAPVRDLKPDLPGFLGDVVGRCLEIPVHKRYQSAREVLQDLAIWRGGSTHMTIGPTMRGMMPTTTVAKKRVRLAAVGAVAAVVVAVMAAGVFWLRGRAPSAEGEGGAAVVPTEVVSLAILPFQNASGDAEMAWLGSGLAEMLRTDVGQTPSLRTVSSDRLHQVFRDLRIAPDTSLEEVTLRRVAEFANADTVVWGQYLKFGEQIRIDATVRDFERHQTATLKAEAANEQQLLRAVQELAQGVRDNLALSRKAVKEAEEQAFIPSAGSMVALRHYTEGLEFMRQGNNLDAVTAFETAVEGDPNFALAHSTLAQAYLNLGREQMAEEASRTAVDLSDDLPQQERFLIMAQNARVESDYEAGVDAYQNLLRTRPADAELNYQLALLYEDQGSFESAREYISRALETDPQNISAQLALGRVLYRSGQPEDALTPLNQALSLAIQVDNQEARANVLQALGNVYRRLRRLDEALKNLEESLEIKRAIGDPRGVSASLSGIGYIQDLSGDADAARASYQEALQISREVGDDVGVGQVLLALGDLERIRANYEEALQYTKEALRVQIEAGDQRSQAQSLNNIGTIYHARGEYGEAIVYYERALEVREQLGQQGSVADTLHNIAETYLYMGNHDKSVDNYMRALEVRREEADEFGAGIESYSLGRVYGLQGRYGAALASMESALETFRRIGESGLWYVDVLAGYGNALSLLGRFDEAAPVLDEALELARGLEDDAQIAQVLTYQGDRLLYVADFDAARTLYAEAESSATASGDPYLVLAARSNIARNDLMRGSASPAAPLLEALVEEAQSSGATYLGTRCTICLSSAQLSNGQAAEAEKNLRRALREAENMGAEPLVAQSHHLLAEALRAQGNQADAGRHLAKAAESIARIREEAASDGPLRRADLEPIVRATGAGGQ
jgi:tetratricopeptide (TPR) repeat protein/predicted Ser/Thr protein kinase